MSKKTQTQIDLGGLMERLDLSSPEAQKILEGALSGDLEPLLDQINSGIKTDDALNRIAFAAMYLRILDGVAPVTSGGSSVLKELRDEGSVEAGEIYALLGDGYPLPQYPKLLIDQAAKWSVWYIKTMIEHTDQDDYAIRSNPYAPFKRCHAQEGILDLFLRCLGVRRSQDGLGRVPYHQDAAEFWRKIHDLGGLK